MIRFLPVPLYDTRRCQLFFEKMHREGKHLRQVWGPLAFFKKGEPEDTIYRIVPMADFRVMKKPFTFGLPNDYLGEMPSSVKMAEIAQDSWKYIQRYLNIFIFRGSRKEIRAEFPANEDDKKRIRNLPWNNEINRIMIGVFIQLSFMTFVVVGNEGLVSSFVEGDALPIVLIWLRLLIGVIRTSLYKRKIKDELALRDEEIENWKEKSTKRRIWNWIYRIAFIGIFLLFIFGFEHYGEYSLTEENIEMSAEVLRLEDIEDIQTDENIAFNPNYRSYYNEADISGSLLAPLKYELWEKYMIEGRVTDDREVYEAELRVKYYEFASEGIRKTMVHDMRLAYSDLNRSDTIESDVFDTVYIEESEWGTRLIIGWENRAMYILYDGEQSVETVLHAVEEVHID